MRVNPWAIALGLLGLSCGDGGRPLPAPRLWDAPAVEPLDGASLGELGWLADVSPWISAGCGRGQPADARHMGDLAVGNGQVFALTGYGCPLNSLHTMIGPNYQKEEAFFDDTSSGLWVEGAPEPVVSGHLFRHRDGPLVVTRERSARLELVTLTFAPLSDPLGSATGLWSAQPAAARAILRVFWIRNLSQVALTGLELRTEPGREARDDRRRRLVALEPADAVAPAALGLGGLGPGEVRRVALAYLLSFQGEGEADALAELRARGADGLAVGTRDAWRAWLARGARLETPDPMVDDLWRGLLITVKVQQAAAGGIAPMSEYSHVWSRDLIGPARLLLAAGLHAEVVALLEYYHLAAADRGDYANAYRLDVPAEPPPPEPDWDALPPFSGRTAAEGPSHVPWMARLLALAAGDHTPAERWFPFLRRALVGQPFDARGLLGFSGDETYRPAMAVALGWDMQTLFEDCCASANSSFLFAVAAEGLAAEAEAVGRAGDAAELAALAAAAREAAEQAFWDEGQGIYLPFLDRTQPGFVPPPFEDVLTQPLWTGYLGAEAPRALRNLEAGVARLGRPDGLLVSPLHPVYDDFMGLGIHQGVYTGMAPAYALHGLATVDHPSAALAFDALRRVVSPSGNLGEMQIYDDHSALQIIYDRSGVLGDYAARFRPWEGGITGEALFFFLTGLVPDAPAARVALAPRLPNDWPRLAARGLRVGEVRFDLELEEHGGRRLVRVRPEDGALTVALEVPLPAGRVTAVWLGGERLPPGRYRVRESFGLPRVILPEAPASAAAPLEARVDWEPG